MRRTLLRLALALGLAIGVIAPASALEMFATAQEAQRYCPNDVVVWLNIPTSIYHMPGTRWYGATKHGAYVCEQEANKAGDRQSRNGQ